MKYQLDIVKGLFISLHKGLLTFKKLNKDILNILSEEPSNGFVMFRVHKRCSMIKPLSFIFIIVGNMRNALCACSISYFGAFI